MTDSEKLDLLLSKIGILESEMQELKIDKLNQAIKVADKTLM